MKLKRKFKFYTAIPSSSQSDIAFLLIIFFIVTAIFFERTGIVFKLPSGSSKTLRLTSKEFIKIEAYNDYAKINSKKVEYSDIHAMIQDLKQVTKNNVAIVYFNDDLKYEKFIRIFQDIKKIGDIKISIKPLK